MWPPNLHELLYRPLHTRTHSSFLSRLFSGIPEREIAAARPNGLSIRVARAGASLKRCMMHVVALFCLLEIAALYVATLTIVCLFARYILLAYILQSTFRSTVHFTKYISTPNSYPH